MIAAHLPSWLGVAAGYLLLGALVGVGLRQRGHSTQTGMAAVLAWPLMVQLLSQAAVPAPPVRAQGPLAARIEPTFALIFQALESGPDLPAWSDQLHQLRGEIFRADARLAWVSTLLEGGPPSGAEPAHAHLCAAHDRAVDELGAVLAGVDRLRLSLGLLALSELRTGPTASLDQGLAELRARVAALDELTTPPPGILAM